MEKSMSLVSMVTGYIHHRCTNHQQIVSSVHCIGSRMHFCTQHSFFFLNLIHPGDYCEVNLCHNGGTCVTGVGDEPFICICADGFGGDTCNLTETGTAKRKLFGGEAQSDHSFNLPTSLHPSLRALQSEPLQERRVVRDHHSDQTRRRL